MSRKNPLLDNATPVNDCQLGCPGLQGPRRWLCWGCQAPDSRVTGAELNMPTPAQAQRHPAPEEPPTFLALIAHLPLLVGELSLGGQCGRVPDGRCQGHLSGPCWGQEPGLLARPHRCPVPAQHLLGLGCPLEQ